MTMTPRRLALLAVLPLMAATTAGAQVTIFEDEAARQRLGELAEKLALLESSMQKLAVENSKLVLEKQQLVDQVRLLSDNVEDAKANSAIQARRIEDLDSHLQAQIAENSTQLGSQIEQLQSGLINDATKLYVTALEARSQNKFLEGQKIFRHLIMRFPDSRYVPSAHYWLGSMAFEDGSFEMAENELQTLLSYYPGSLRIPDAILLLHDIAATQGEALEQRHWQNLLLRSYPTSPVTDLLRLRI